MTHPIDDPTNNTGDDDDEAAQASPEGSGDDAAGEKPSEPEGEGEQKEEEKKKANALDRFQKFLKAPVGTAAKQAFDYAAALATAPIGDAAKQATGTFTEIVGTAISRGVGTVAKGAFIMADEKRLHKALDEMKSDGQSELDNAEQLVFDELAEANPELAKTHKPTLKILTRKLKGRFKKENAQLLAETIELYGHVAGGALVSMWVASQFMPPMHPAMFPFSSTIYLAVLVKGPKWTRDALEKTPFKMPVAALDKLRSSAIRVFEGVFKGALGYSGEQLEAIAGEADKRGLTPAMMKDFFKKMDAAYGKAALDAEEASASTAEQKALELAREAAGQGKADG